ncbi:hypothetical protein FACS189472_15310 [Alphaproteobacteria bacterium]|nr:hypothetical protein FACS189472_15310 [Alphaproteobacteria bacterium]
MLTKVSLKVATSLPHSEIPLKNRWTTNDTPQLKPCSEPVGYMIGSEFCTWSDLLRFQEKTGCEDFIFKNVDDYEIRIVEPIYFHTEQDEEILCFCD